MLLFVQLCSISSDTRLWNIRKGFIYIYLQVAHSALKVQISTYCISYCMVLTVLCLTTSVLVTITSK
jgi:hypothetical protein